MAFGVKRRARTITGSGLILTSVLVGIEIWASRNQSNVGVLHTPTTIPAIQKRETVSNGPTGSNTPDPAKTVVEGVRKLIEQRQPPSVKPSAPSASGIAEELAKRFHKSANRLVIDCDSLMLPINIQKSEMYILVPFPRHNSFAKSYKRDGGIFGVWPARDAPPEVIERCELGNYGDAAAVNVLATATITFIRVEHGSDGSHVLRTTTDIIAINEAHIDVPVITQGGKVEFYIHNTGEYAVDILWLDSASINGTETVLDITNRSRRLRMFPMEKAVP